MRFSVLILSFFLLCRVASATTVFVQVGQGGGLNFTPSDVVISQGDTIQWDWVSGRHSVTSGTPGNPDGLFDSGISNTPHSFSFTFPTPGNYHYYCMVHGAMMTGTVFVAVIDPPSPTVGPTTTPTPTVTPTSTPTPTPNPTPTPTPTSTPVHTPTPTPASPTPTSTPVHTPTPTPASPTPTATPVTTATPTPAPTLTPTPAPTPTPTAVPTTTPAPSATPTATATPTAGPAQALNISTRLRVQTGNNVLIGGFIVTGTAPKRVVVRGLGPSLTSGGIPDALADPTLELHESNGTLLFSNDNWQDDPTQAAQLSALGIAPADPAESGIVISLPPAAYTAILAGKNNGTGIGLVEVYDADQAADSHLANISTRGFVLTGNNVMIGGFILGGSGNTHIVLRGIGPSLAQQGLNPVLDDPTLELHDGNGAVLVMNDNWQDDPVSASQLTAIGLGPQDPLESGIYVSLPPGAFTAILAGKNGGTGIGLVEVYNLGP